MSTLCLKFSRCARCEGTTPSVGHNRAAARVCRSSCSSHTSMARQRPHAATGTYAAGASLLASGETAGIIVVVPHALLSSRISSAWDCCLGLPLLTGSPDSAPAPLRGCGAGRNRGLSNPARRPKAAQSRRPLPRPSGSPPTHRSPRTPGAVTAGASHHGQSPYLSRRCHARARSPQSGSCRGTGC